MTKRDGLVFEMSWPLWPPAAGRRLFAQGKIDPCETPERGLTRVDGGHEGQAQR